MEKRVFAALLTCVFAAGVLAGCGGDGSSFAGTDRGDSEAIRHYVNVIAVNFTKKNSASGQHPYCGCRTNSLK